MNTPWFALIVQRRRQALALRRTDLSAAGGPSYMTMQKVESGTGTLQSTTLASLDNALEWPPGASLRALDPRIESLEGALAVLGEVDVRRIKIQPRTEHRNADRRSPRPRLRSEQPRPQQQRAINTRALLVAAAAHEFASNGYAAASVNTILETAQCTKGAMYFHFKSKEAMAHAVLDEIHTTYAAIAARWMTEDSAHPLDAIAYLIDEIAGAIDSTHIPRAETRLALEAEFRTRRPSLVWESAIQELADKARREGALRGRIAGETLSNSLVNTLSGIRYLHEIRAAGEPLRNAFRGAADSAFAAFANEHYRKTVPALRPEQSA